MKTISLRIGAVFLACVGSSFLTTTAHATGQARAEFRNISSAQAATQLQNPGVAFFGGYLKGPQTQTANAVILQECSFGQAFSQWYPSDTYARDILGANGVSGVRGALYPGTTFTSDLRNEIANSGKPFRYKWLLYGGAGTDVTAFDVTTLANWFTPADRVLVAEQIAVLKEAVAASPLDTSLRNALLDVYCDLAVAEMQATKPLLAKLAKFRLGLEVLPPDKFIIDEEIDTYVEITDAMLAAINQYTSLLVDDFPGIDPSSIDSSVPFGSIPMGRYIFLREQPRRSSIPSKYADQSGVREVPQLDVNGQPVVPVNPGSLFVGYKDLNTLLQIVGQRQLQLAGLARLRGNRKAPGDLARARESIIQVAGDDVTQLQLIKSWFPELFPPDLNAISQGERTTVEALLQQSGVLASLAAVELGRLELSSITPLLNGSANVLGYDPDFLLLVQDGANLESPRESYDVLRAMLIGPNQPLSVALTKLAAATSAYNSFQEKVDRVATDIDDADETLANRFFAITGFEPDASPGFDPIRPNPTTGSELGGALATIAALNARAAARIPLNQELDDQFKVGADGVASGAALDDLNAAQNKRDLLLAAGQTYRDTTASLYNEMIGASVASATAQAAYEAVADTASTGADVLDPVTGITHAAAATIIGVAGAVNTVVQAGAAYIIGSREQAIDYAGIDFAITTEAVDAALAVNQAREQLSALKREQISNNLEQLSDQGALSQAVAQREALLAEVARIGIKRNANVAAIRKKSYADPLHYYRAENALIDADESFRTAQRWMFYTLQALNYKWHGQFATSTGTKFYDTSTVFKCRNAGELNDLLSQMVVWNDDRVAQTVNSPRLFTRISLRDHIFARDPNRYDPNLADPGTRVDDTQRPLPTPPATLPTIQYFRKVLNSLYRKGAGTSDDRWEIPFSTAFRNHIADRVDGNFFRGATYDVNGNISDKGFWREKIDYVAVNIVADDGFDPDSVSGPRGLSGVLYYGGTVYFHTRVPPNGNRGVIPVANPTTGLFDDYPGELMISPFRFWVSPNFNSNFIPRNEDDPPIQVAYSNSSIALSGPNGINTKPSFQNFDLTGRSIAASGWRLRIPRLNNVGFVVDVNKINDIELIVAYRHSTRVSPPPN